MDKIVINKIQSMIETVLTDERSILYKITFALL